MSSKPIHIMVDTETMGTGPGCVIASIGAVPFDPVAGTINTSSSFYRTANIAGQQLVIDGNTVKWWLQQSGEAREALLKGNEHIAIVLAAFNSFWAQYENQNYPVYFWCHGAGFDEPIIKFALETYGLQIPWKFRNVRDTRTIFDLTGVNIKNSGTSHNALDDALAQAEAVCEAYRVLGIKAV